MDERLLAEAAAYKVLSLCLAYPDDQLLDMINSGIWQEMLNALTDYDLIMEPEKNDWDCIELFAKPLEEIQIIYTGIFDIGLPEPPCPPYSGLYIPEGRNFPGPRTVLMANLNELYQKWGLTVQEELPDHVAVELGFLHFLKSMKLQTAQEDNIYTELTNDCLWMQKHFHNWLPEFSKVMKAQDENMFWYRAVNILSQLLN